MARFVTGRDCDAWCTRCKMDLAHTIVAMVDGLPKRVKCNTCDSHHNYHRPRAERDAEKAERAAKRAARKSSSGGSRSSGSRVASTSSAAIREIWGQRMSASEDQPTHLYNFRESFSENDGIEHPKFGRGVVIKLISPQKMRVLFQDGEHMLAMGR